MSAIHTASPRRQALLFFVVAAPFMFASRYLPVPSQAIPTAILLVATLLFLRWDGRPPAVLGLDASWRRLGEFAAGFGGGALLVLVGAGLIYLWLPFHWAFNPHFELTAAASALLYFFISNLGEELAFRGYGFERLIAWLGHWPAQIITALMFALGHILNGWAWQTALIGVTSGSLLFGLVFVRWRSLPAAVGVHMSGNMMRALFLEDPASTNTFYAPAAARLWTPSEQLTANVILVGVTLLSCVMLAWSIRSKRLTENP